MEKVGGETYLQVFGGDSADGTKFLRAFQTVIRERARNYIGPQFAFMAFFSESVRESMKARKHIDDIGMVCSWGLWLFSLSNVPIRKFWTDSTNRGRTVKIIPSWVRSELVFNKRAKMSPSPSHARAISLEQATQATWNHGRCRELLAGNDVQIS
eukprot:729034-Hanusia_phi.AAC.3